MYIYTYMYVDRVNVCVCVYTQLHFQIQGHGFRSPRDCAVCNLCVLYPAYTALDTQRSTQVKHTLHKHKQGVPLAVLSCWAFIHSHERGEMGKVRSGVLVGISIHMGRTHRPCFPSC